MTTAGLEIDQQIQKLCDVEHLPTFSAALTALGKTPCSWRMRQITLLLCYRIDVARLDFQLWGDFHIQCQLARRLESDVQEYRARNEDLPKANRALSLTCGWRRQPRSISP